MKLSSIYQMVSFNVKVFTLMLKDHSREFNKISLRMEYVSKGRRYHLTPYSTYSSAAYEMREWFSMERYHFYVVV